MTSLLVTQRSPVWWRYKKRRTNRNVLIVSLELGFKRVLSPATFSSSLVEQSSSTHRSCTRHACCCCCVLRVFFFAAGACSVPRKSPTRFHFTSLLLSKSRIDSDQEACCSIERPMPSLTGEPVAAWHVFTAIASQNFDFVQPMCPWP